MDIEKKDIFPEEKISQEKPETKEGGVERERSPERDKEKEREIRERLKKLRQNVSSVPVSQRDEKKEIEKIPSHQGKVGALISLASEKGLEYATKIAKSLDNPAIMDDFHDLLIDQHRDELFKQGITDKIE